MTKLYLKIVRRIRNFCDSVIEKHEEKAWVPHSEEHNDKYCSHCGFMCDRCFRPY